MFSINRRLNAISRCYSLYRAENSSQNLQGIYHSYIFAICYNPGSSQDFLAKYLCKNKSSVTRHLTFLEKEGLIERKSSLQDKRELLVYPTEKMIELFPETKEISKKWTYLLTKDISENDLEIFKKVLDQMYISAKEVIFNKEQEK